MWDVDSGKELHRFTGHNGCVHQLSLSSDAKRLVSSSADGTSKVWDLATVTRKLDGTPLEHPSSPPPLHPPCTVIPFLSGGKERLCFDYKTLVVYSWTGACTLTCFIIRLPCGASLLA